MLRFYDTIGICTVPTLPESGSPGEFVYCAGSFYGWTGSSWKSLNNDSTSKADVGLGNVDNTSDLNKPVSSATQTALNAKASLAIFGTSVNGLVPAPISAGGYYLKDDGTWGAPVVQMCMSAIGRLGSGQIFARYIASERLVISQDLSKGSSRIASTSDAVVTMYNNGFAVATFTWFAGQTIATINVTSPAIIPGDVITFQNQSIADGTLADIAINMTSTR